MRVTGLTYASIPKKPVPQKTVAPYIFNDAPSLFNGLFSVVLWLRGTSRTRKILNLVLDSVLNQSNKVAYFSDFSLPYPLVSCTRIWGLQRPLTSSWQKSRQWNTIAKSPGNPTLLVLQPISRELRFGPPFC